MNFINMIAEKRDSFIEEGRREGIREIAKELLKSGMKPKDVEKYTKLSRKEIEKIKFNQ